MTYPLATTMLSVPGAKAVRGYSMFGDSFVYVLFDDGTDLYWARSRVLEYLNQVQSRLPAQAKASLGPDATGVGWIYEYALVDRTGRVDLSQLRALQDWFFKYELKTVPNVAEVASVGGMVRQYQIVLVIGGMITALVLSMFVVPVAYLVVCRLPMRAAEAQARRVCAERTGATHPEMNKS